MFDYFKKVAISSRADDELLYEFVLSEMENGVVAKGLWGKALANSAGDDANAKSIYMKYRVQSIKDIFTAQKIAYSELSKPKLFQYIEDKIFPMTNDYTNLIPQENLIETKDHSVSKEEEALYDEVADELSKDIRKEGLWLKAIQNTDGDENRALALYIKYRSEAIKIEKQEAINRQVIKEQKLTEEKHLKEEIKFKQSIEYREKTLAEFLKNNHMTLNKRISDNQVKSNIDGSVYDSYIEYKNFIWGTVDRVLYEN